MSEKETRTIELDAVAAEVLEARAAERGVSVSQLLVELLDADTEWPSGLEESRRERTEPWRPDDLAEDEARSEEFERTRMGVPWDEVRTWLQSWGKPDELPPPKPRKL